LKAKADLVRWRERRLSTTNQKARPLPAAPVLNERLATTETAVAEACHRLRRLRPALAELTELIAGNRVLLVPVLSEHPRRVGELLAKYPLMDVGDATLVVLSELWPRARLITVDDDFRHYRRLRNQAVPVVMPGRK